MNVQDYLADRGITIPVVENDTWLFWEASSECGKLITQIILESAPLLKLCHDVRPELWKAILRQCDIIAFG